jgi:hypothetical protein
MTPYDFFLWVGIGCILYGPLHYIYKKIVARSYISYFEAISIVKEELEQTQIVDIIRNLPEKYHHQYWLNVINMNVGHSKKIKLSTRGYITTSIKENMQEISDNIFLVDKKQLRKYIDTVLKEENKHNDSLEVMIEDESKISELKTIDELINNKKGTVEDAINTQEISEKLKFTIY